MEGLGGAKPHVQRKAGKTTFSYFQPGKNYKIPLTLFLTVCKHTTCHFMFGLGMTYFLDRFRPYSPVRKVLLAPFLDISPTVWKENSRKVPETSCKRELVNSLIINRCHLTKSARKRLELIGRADNSIRAHCSPWANPRWIFM